MNSIKRFAEISAILISAILLLSSCGTGKEEPFLLETDSINQMVYDSQSFDFSLYSEAYLLADLSQMKVIYAFNEDKEIYPASLTKLLTMDTILHLGDLQDTAYVDNEQIIELIREDASIADLVPQQDYSICDLLYALILPSGADAAAALENYAESLGVDLVEQMNLQAQKLGCRHSSFINTTGLHEDDHYSSLNDLLLIVMDILQYKTGREILETFTYQLDDGKQVISTLLPLSEMEDEVLGGKTGYTPEAGQNVMVLFRHNHRSYLLLLANARGGFELRQNRHFQDVSEVFMHLFAQ